MVFEKRNKCLNTILNDFLFFLLNHLDVFYKQFDGAVMGSPMRSTLANSFLVYHQHKCLESCPIKFRPKYYHGYVDDIFRSEHKNHVKQFLRYMNLHYPNIQFTCEKESNDKSSFLDKSTTRLNSKLVTSLYRMKRFSGVYLNYNSFLKTNYKKGLINTLLFQSYNIRADYIILHNEIKYLKIIWQKKSFPLIFIDNCIKKT